MIGICRGVIADGVIEESEAIFLGQWIENHREVADKWPVNVQLNCVTRVMKSRSYPNVTGLMRWLNAVSACAVLKSGWTGPSMRFPPWSSRNK